MRGAIEIVWLEDNPKDGGHKDRVKSVKSIISDKGYDTNIFQVKNLKEAKSIIANPGKRVDFFISDYNLGVNETGLDYLLEIRRKNMYRQFFILYSKNEYDEIRNGVIDKLRDNDIELFCNFTFISLSNGSPEMIEGDFAKAINISLSRWDELNAIRGLYMCEHAELEFLLREKFKNYISRTDKKRAEKINKIDEKSYKELFYELKHQANKNYQKSNKSVYDEWAKLIDYRNLLAHTIEGYNSSEGFYIKSALDENVVIYEKELDKCRSNLKLLKQKIKILIDNPNQHC